MDVERTMEFILEQQARNQSLMAEVISAQRNSDRRLDRLERTVTRLARLGLKARAKLNGRLDDHEKWLLTQSSILDRVDETLREVGDKLNGLIAVVDRWPRNPA